IASEPSPYATITSRRVSARGAHRARNRHKSQRNRSVGTAPVHTRHSHNVVANDGSPPPTARDTRDHTQYGGTASNDEPGALFEYMWPRDGDMSTVMSSALT